MTTPAKPIHPKLMTIPEVASALSIGLNRTRNLVASGDIPRVPEKFTGRNVRVHRDVVRSLLREWGAA